MIDPGNPDLDEPDFDEPDSEMDEEELYFEFDCHMDRNGLCGKGRFRRV